jgi:cyclic-di-GMP phosphodiesterase, flagellum assembly factor TipF
MPLLVHIAIASTYLAAAAAIAFGVPVINPAASGAMALMAGALMLIAGALVHEAASRRIDARALGRELKAHRRQQNTVMGELAHSRAELHQLQEALEAASRKRANGAGRDVENVMHEVRVLRSLVDKISGVPSSGAIPDVLVEAADEPIPPQVPLPEAEILNAVREGLAADRVDLYLQPIVSLPQRRRRYFECYSRIRTADGDILMPGQYLAVAAREGLIAAIDNLLLLRCVQLVRKSQQRRFDVGFFCHVSPHTLEDETFLAQFVDFLLENTDLAKYLFLEFAYADAEGRSEAVGAQLAKLAEAGFRFSVDQVPGFNFDPMKLRNLHIGFVKIGAAAALEAAEHGGMHMMKAGLERAGIELIVEKIESEPMLLDLLDHDIDYGQGYLFGPPRPSRDAA